MNDDDWRSEVRDELGAESLAMLCFLAGLAMGALGTAIGVWLAR